jgi:hypothetical protein
VLLFGHGLDRGPLGQQQFLGVQRVHGSCPLALGLPITRHRLRQLNHCHGAPAAPVLALFKQQSLTTAHVS